MNPSFRLVMTANLTRQPTCVYLLKIGDIFYIFMFFVHFSLSNTNQSKSTMVLAEAKVTPQGKLPFRRLASTITVARNHRRRQPPSPPRMISKTKIMSYRRRQREGSNRRPTVWRIISTATPYRISSRWNHRSPNRNQWPWRAVFIV